MPGKHTMNLTTYHAGTRVFCDFHFGGKPKGVVERVESPGRGNVPSSHPEAGKLVVRLTETVGAYQKGERLTLPACTAVPRKQEFRKRGSFFRWVRTDYQFAP